MMPKSCSRYSIPRYVHQCYDYRHLSGNGVKLHNALAFQFVGTNNGNLTAAWALMRDQHGFRSNQTLRRAKQELLAAHLIVITRKAFPMSKTCDLIGLTWAPIPDLGTKLDCAPCTIPRKNWNTEAPATDADLLITWKREQWNQE